MNHQKIYDNIIEKAKSEIRVKCNEIYYENHHIIPRCLNGSDEDVNKVLLIAKEHYVCHKLLTFIYPSNRKIALAFFYMTFNKRLNIKISSKDYAYAKELLHKIPISEETKHKISINNGSRRPEVGKKISEALQGHTQTEETKEKRAKKHRGRKNTEQTKQLMSSKSIGKPKAYDVWNKNKTFLNITPIMINEIKTIYQAGKLQREISQIYNFSNSCVSRILRGIYDNKTKFNK